MEQQIREIARKYLPERIRRPLGTLIGRFHQEVIRGLMGAAFDLGGGRFRVDGCTLSIPKDLTTRSYRACFFDGSYEAEERGLIRKWVRAEDRVIELGACLGIVSCVTNRLLADKSKHLVIEANPFCIPSIYRNKELNNAGFLVEHCAVDTRPEVTFYLHPLYVVGGTSQRKSNRPCRVPAKSLEQLEREHGPFDVLIIDIEGSELDVFQCSKKALNTYRLVIAELHEFAIGADGVEQCRELLRTAGLTQVDRSGITEVWKRN